MSHNMRCNDTDEWREPMGAERLDLSIWWDRGPLPAERLYCARCGPDAVDFQLFMVDGFDHYHFQCSRCDQNYCAGDNNCETRGS